MRSDDGGDLIEGTFDVLCRKCDITQGFASSSSVLLNGVAEGTLGLIEAAVWLQEYKFRYYFRTSSCLLPISYGQKLCRGRAILLTVLQRVEPRQQIAARVVVLAVNLSQITAIIYG